MLSVSSLFSGLVPTNSMLPWVADSSDFTSEYSPPRNQTNLYSIPLDLQVAVDDVAMVQKELLSGSAQKSG
jgi:hypothetical protein